MAKKIRITGVPKFKGGGAVDPLYVQSKVDPRYKAYTDSTTQFRNSENAIAQYNKNLIGDKGEKLLPGKKVNGMAGMDYMMRYPAVDQRNDGFQAVNVPHYPAPRQQVIVGNPHPSQYMRALPVQGPQLPTGTPTPGQMQPIQNVPSMPLNIQREWYSNSQGIPMDAPEAYVSTSLYNPDGSKKYQQYGGPIISYKDGGAVSPEDAAIASVLMNRNRGKNFVDRAYNNDTSPRLQTNKIPGYRDTPNNRYSTELMSYDVNPDGTGRVYPEIVQKPGDKELTYLGGDRAWDYADSTGEYITTPNAKTADMLSNYGYKKATNIPTNQYGGLTMNKKIRITGVPAMEFGGLLPRTGQNINGGYSNRAIDTRWYPYQSGNPYAYAPDPYSTKRTIPKTKEMDHREGETYEVEEDYANHLKSLGYEFKIVG